MYNLLIVLLVFVGVIFAFEYDAKVTRRNNKKPFSIKGAEPSAPEWVSAFWKSKPFEPTPIPKSWESKKFSVKPESENVTLWNYKDVTEPKCSELQEHH